MSSPDAGELGRWAARCLSGPAGSVASMTPLRPDAPRWRIEVTGGRATTAKRAIVKSGDAGMREELATEAAALLVAEEHGLATPRLIAADLDGHDTGHPVLLLSYIEGTNRIPARTTPQRLRQLGAAAARIHQVARSASEGLPRRHRHMPWIDFSAMRRAGTAPSTPLLERGDLAAAALPAVDSPTVLVHGDLWTGNTIWRGDWLVATIDWEAAGVGHPGVDLGSLRLDAALLDGADAADQVLAGWTSAIDDPSSVDVAAWDLVAALNTPADLDGVVDSFHQAGRTDLDGAVLTRRRDAFVEGALRAIDA